MSLHRRIRCPRPMAGSHHRCHHQSPPQSTTLAPHHRHPSLARRRPRCPTTALGAQRRHLDRHRRRRPRDWHHRPQERHHQGSQAWPRADSATPMTSPQSFHYRVEQSTVRPTGSGRTRKPPRLIANLNPAGARSHRLRDASSSRQAGGTDRGARRRHTRSCTDGERTVDEGSWNVAERPMMSRGLAQVRTGGRRLPRHQRCIPRCPARVGRPEDDAARARAAFRQAMDIATASAVTRPQVRTKPQSRRL